MKRQNEDEILDEYFRYLKSEEAAIVFITKNLVNSVNTKKKCDVVEFDCWGERDGKYKFNFFIIELFERKIRPKYPKGAIKEMNRAITWKAAHEDIKQQRSKGIRGPMFFITCHLTTTVARKIDKKPDWKYKITGEKKIDINQLQNIQRNYTHIYERILEESYVKIDWLFEKY